METTWIAPSILSADFARLGEEVDAVMHAGADLIHFDVMDNHYVPNLTIGPMVCEALHRHSPDTILDVDRTIELLHDQGCTAGLVLNPATPLQWLDYTLGKLDLVLIMSVNPGFGGQKFIMQALEKLKVVRARIDAQTRPVRLEVDGGVKVENIGLIAAAGADTFVAGSAVFGSADYVATLKAMRAAIDAAR